MGTVQSHCGRYGTWNRWVFRLDRKTAAEGAFVTSTTLLADTVNDEIIMPMQKIQQHMQLGKLSELLTSVRLSHFVVSELW